MKPKKGGLKDPQKLTVFVPYTKRLMTTVFEDIVEILPKSIVYPVPLPKVKPFAFIPLP